jgi:hypothetical protein
VADEQKRVSGTAFPTIQIGTQAATSEPVPIVLSKRTLLVMTVPTLLLVCGALSTGLYYVKDTATHKTDAIIHLARDERPKLQTMERAKADRLEMIQTIVREQRLLQREIQVQQVEQLQRIGQELTEKQERHFRALVSEGRQTRAVLKNRDAE